MDQELLAQILYLFGNLFRMYLIYQFLKAFFTLTVEKRWYIPLRFSMYGIFFILNSMGFLYFHWDSTVIILSNVVGVFLLTLTYRGKWKYRISATFLIVALCVICEDLIYRLLLRCNIVHIADITVALSDLLLLMLVLFAQKLSDLRRGEDISVWEWTSIIVVPVISMILSVVTLDKCSDAAAVTIGGIGILVLNIFVFYFFDRMIKMQQAQAQLAALNNQNQAYLKQLGVLIQSEEKASAFRHDINNHIAMLQHLSEQDNSSAVQQYLGEMTDLMQPEGNFSSTGDLLIDGMINLKLGEAKAKLQAEIECDIDLSNAGGMDGTDVSILLGNLLDNAIQAMEKCQPPRRLKFWLEGKRGLMIIRIRNNHNEEIKEKEGQFISTKRSRTRHGLGLKNVKRIVEKYHGDMKVEYDDSWFSVEILLFLNNNE